MSSQSGTFGNNQAIINTDVSKIFLRDNRYQKGNELNNGSYNPLVLVAGTLMGRVGSSNNVVPLYSAASDGSQFPIGVLAQDISIVSGDTKEVAICDYGDVASDKVVLYYTGDSLETVVSSRRLKDYVQAQGIKLITSTEMTQLDNQ